ncbi:MAG: peptidoglycan recognition family protein [Baekduia sp.]
MSVDQLLATLLAAFAPAVPAQSSATAAAEARRPPIVQRPIPYGAERKRQMAAYSQRHYGHRHARLSEVKVIVEHYTVTRTFSAAWNTFAANARDPELGELPGVCAHFIVDRDGTIYQLVPLNLMCRHTIGLNDRSIGIEQVGMSAAEILARPSQRRAIVRLSAWLRCRYDVAMTDLIGHAMSLSSPWHHERVAALRNRTHGDWTAAELRPVRREIDEIACP